MTKDLNLFFDKFDKLAESPNGVKKLRELILQLAVQGKLVPQDPKDEPASELLKKIKAEKEKLIKEGKIKKQKPFATIKTNEMPIKLPLNWAFVRLGSISNIVYGKNLPVKDLTNDGYPVWGANGIIGCYSKYLYEESQLLISCRGAYSGKINMSPPNAFITNNSLVLEMTPIAKTSMHYLFYCLTALDKAKLVSGSAQPQVTTKNASPLIIPIPPLAEQKRIVAKVDELMALCDKLEEKQQKARHGRIVLNNSAIDHLLTAKTPNEFKHHWKLVCDSFDLLYSCPENVDKLRQATLQLAVKGKLVPQNPNDEPASVLLEKIRCEKEKLIKEGKIKKQKPLAKITDDEKPFDLPSKWDFAKIDDCLLVIKNGFSGKQSKIKTSFPITRIETISLGKINYEKVGYASQIEKADKEKHIMLSGDILLSHINSDYHIGKTAIYDGIHPLYHGVNLLLLRSHRLIKPEFIRIYLEALRWSGYFLSVAKHAIGQASINQSLIKNLIIALPPLAEQKRIVAKVDELMMLVAELEAKLNQAKSDSDKLIASVVYHLLSRLPQRGRATTPYKNDAAVVCFLLAEMEKLHRSTTEFFIQKHMFVTKHHLHLPVNSLFVRKAAGPWSQELRRKAIHAAIKTNWLNWDKKGNLIRGSSFTKGINHAATVLGEHAAQITQLVEDLKLFGSNGLERWTTVLKVVEDLKETQQPITRSNIQHEINTWRDKRLKKIFAEESVDYTITMMLKHNWLSPLNKP